MAASRGPIDPDLYSHIFEPDIAGEIDETGVLTPESSDDFEAILAMLGDDTGEPNAPLSDEAARAFAMSLGFASEDD